ncbi:MAG: hypothetical protein GY720_02825 [bacterium]|nr:hypothetical protein [bacterium]
MPLTPDEEAEMRRLAQLAADSLETVAPPDRTRLRFLARRYALDWPKDPATQKWAADVETAINRCDPAPHPPDLSWAQQATGNAIPQPPPSQAKDLGPAKWAAPVGFGLVIVGSFGPWVTVATVFSSISVAGTTGDGIPTLVAAIAGVMISLMAPSRLGQWVAIVLGAGITLVAAYDMTDIARLAAETSNQYVRASVGWGLIMTLVGGIIGGGAPILNLWPRQ